MLQKLWRSDLGTHFRRVFLERNRLHEGIPGVQEELPGECPWKGKAFLESVPGENRLHEGIPGIQEKLPGEFSWKEIGITRVFLESRKNLLESACGLVFFPV